MARKRTTTPGPYLLYLEMVRDRITDPKRYPFALPALRGLETLGFHSKVTFLVGENGSGKSTLLEAIAVAWGLNQEGGSLNFNFATRASHSPLGDCIRLARPPSTPRDSYFLRAESFFNVATEIERLGVVDAYSDRSLHEQSHGESFFALFENRFGDHGLYLMDEPEAALSDAAGPVSRPAARLSASRLPVRDRDALADHPRLPRGDDLPPERRRPPGSRLHGDRALPGHPWFSREPRPDALGLI